MLCSNCRTSSYYWKKQSLPHMRHRRTMLNLFSARLEHYDPRVAEIINDAQKKVASTRKTARAVSATAASASARH
jgi:hypothetical protein